MYPTDLAERASRQKSARQRELAPADLGRRINAIRRERRWTLQQTQEKTGLSVSALSKIERGILSPTLGTLNKIAQGFRIDVVTLLQPSSGPAPQGRRTVTRSGKGAIHRTATCLNFWLAADITNKRMLPIYARVTACSVDEHDEWSRHEGEIFVYVLHGTLIVHSEHYKPVKLQEGDSIYYDASTGHKWTSDGATSAEVLWIFSKS
jgi:transcriptional regulator with XRE-family HTH domain